MIMIKGQRIKKLIKLPIDKKKQEQPQDHPRLQQMKQSPVIPFFLSHKSSSASYE